MDAYLAGARLATSTNIRTFAERFHRPTVLERWSEILLSDTRNLLDTR